jgi:tRNA (mo5U34)-methyltransferase
MDRDEAMRRIASVGWYHRFEILPGVMTPGKVSLGRETLTHFGIPQDLKGKKVLDVGAWDGPLAFEAEARGATVTALDIQDPDKTGFNTAKAVLDSRVRYIQGSVYDATSLLSDRFDYIFIFGVFYHLKYPILAFERLASLLADDGQLVYEGECLRNYWEDETGKPFDSVDFRALVQSNVPVCLFYSRTYKGDDTNWFIPNPACLRGWMEAAGLRVVHDFFHDDASTNPPQQRTGGVARKVGAPPIEHRLVE